MQHLGWLLLLLLSSLLNSDAVFILSVSSDGFNLFQLIVYCVTADFEILSLTLFLIGVMLLLMGMYVFMLNGLRCSMDILSLRVFMEFLLLFFIDILDTIFWYTSVQ
jgi:hypothetical protein